MNRVSRTGYLGDMLGSLLDQPRKLLGSGRKGSLEALCWKLLSERTEVSSLAIAEEVLARYASLSTDEKSAFFTMINDQLDVDAAQIQDAVEAYARSRTPADYKKLATVTEPKRYELLRRLNQPSGATAELVRMRADLLSLIKSNPELERTDVDFQLMLRAWFNRGFLVLKQITWDSPASILEKIIEYEAVHEIETWGDLRRRLHPTDRRCFAFFHPAMPQEPLIFVEIALSKGVPTSIQDVLADQREVLDAQNTDTAVFYSISNCQPGLAGISFGNSLIKQVVRNLTTELPQVKNFVTLSPVPGFARWTGKQGIETDEADTQKLKKLCAAYLTSRNAKNLPIDPVARFHLQNGALIHAIHAEADTSDAGRRKALGFMVNYAYEADRIASNLQLLAEGEKVATSSAVRTLARQGHQMLAQVAARRDETA
ncbi:MAG: malonyl-CoA decarboxylase family protein [Paracoccaceae bacterium]|nr:malonyl-CoA decarboxylase family protein [Paracoccaceae bacterium]